MATNQDKLVAELSHAKVLVTDGKISNVNQILGVLELANQQSMPLLIIAEDFEPEIITLLVVNKLRGNLNCVAVKAPLFADKRRQMLEDICVLTGATLFSSQLNNDIGSATVADLGDCQRVVVDQNKTTLIEPNSGDNKTAEHIAALKQQLLAEEDSIKKEEISKRIARLAGSVAVISVGAPTEVEMKEKKLRIEDALSATKAAISSGIVAGGGVALLRCKPALDKLIDSLFLDEKTGAEIVAKSIQAPIRQIAQNAYADGGVIVKTVLENDNPNYGYDALHGQFCDMFERGIIDPTLVTISTITSAISVASTMLTTEALVVDAAEQNPATTIAAE
jgi:chaperonin GroEL